MKNWCWIAHDWEFVTPTFDVLPKRGPFDPTSDSKRTVKYYNWVCCQCGQTRKQQADDDD